MTIIVAWVAIPARRTLHCYRVRLKPQAALMPLPLHYAH